MLERAEATMNENPSEAIAVLDSIGDDGLSRSQRMHRLLLLTNAQNKCDTIFRSDSIQRMLVEYYDSHGTANERMLAYYLLGRALYDMGEVPAALESFQDAASCADTLSSDCDYRLLSRVHGQTARLFLEQNAPYNALSEIKLVDKYAWAARDTLMWLINNSQKSSAFQELDMPDSVIAIDKCTYTQFMRYGYSQFAAATLLSSIGYLLESGDTAEAAVYIDRYERESGLVDSCGNVANGAEIFYYYKGLHCLESGNISQAEQLFRKELSESPDRLDRVAALKGLFSVYSKTGPRDSIILYSNLSFTALDSLHKHILTKDIIRMQAVYNYDKQRALAEEEHFKATTNFYIACGLVFILIIVMLLTYMIIIKMKHRQEQIRLNEQRAYSRMRELEQQLTIREINNIEREVKGSDIVQYFIQAAKKPGKNPSFEDWHKIRSLIIQKYPSFWDKLQDCEPKLRMEETDVCMLIRLQFKVKEISNLTGMSQQTISNIRRRLLLRIFHQQEGGSKEFDRLIMKL